jgi:hypothetical protein
VERLEEQSKIVKASPCRTERSSKDRKELACFGLFSYTMQKIHREFIAFCLDVTQGTEKAWWLRRMRPYIHGHLLGAGAAAAVDRFYSSRGNDNETAARWLGELPSIKS